MEGEVSHLWSEESLEAKARWFASLTVEQRVEVFCEMVDFLVELNPSLLRGHDDFPAGWSVRVLEQA